jgi:phospholipid/cholesterol/gamma-HCH transport system substrate-binding protein
MRTRVLSALLTVGLMAGVVGAYELTRPKTDTYTVTAVVEQAPNLFEGGRVTVRGIAMGKLIEIDPRPDGVHLTLELESDIDVPADATLAVVPVTVIADRYVQLFPDYEGGPTLKDGDHIGLERTSIPAELEDVLAQLKGLLEALEPGPNQEDGSLTRLIESLDSVFAGRAEELKGTLRGSAEVLDNLAESRSDIVSLIRNLDRLFASLASRSSQIGVVNERLELVMEALLADQGNLEGTIENIRFLAGETAGLLEESGDELGASLGRLGRVLRTVLRHEDELVEGIKWGNVIAQATGATNASGKGLFAYSGRQAAPGTEGAAYNYRIDSRDVIGCERIQAVANTILTFLPSAPPEEIVNTLLTFIPDERDAHIKFLLEQLVPLCVRQFRSTAMESEVSAALLRLKDQIGEDQLLALLGRWLAERSDGEGS